MKMVRYYVIVFAGVLLFNLSSFAQHYNLNQLLDSALQNNYLLKSTEKNALIKQSELEMLQTNYLPKISTFASFSYWKFLMPNKERLLGDVLTDMYTDIAFYQPIYDFGQTKARKEIVKEEILLNDEIIRQIRYTIIWGVSNTYLDVLKAESEIIVHQSALMQLNNHLKYAENLYEIGKGSSLDILQIKVQISVGENNLQQSKNRLISNKIILIQLCNLENVFDLTIENTATQWFDQYQNISVDHLYFDSIFKKHPTLAVFDIKTDIENIQKDLVRLQTLPELYTYGIGSWEDGYIPFGNNFNYNIGIGVRYTLPYLGNSSHKYKMKQSEIVIEQYRDQKQHNYLEIKREIDLGFNTLDEIQKSIMSNLQIIELSNETIKNALIKYQSGQGNIIDILDAQQILTEAQSAYEKSIINYLQTLARLNYMFGNDNYPF